MPSPQKKRERILDAAFAGFKQQGFHKTTVDEIARRAQVSKGTIYACFRDKEEILVELVDRELCNGFAMAGQAMMEETTALGKLRRLIAISVEYFHTNELIGKVMAMDQGLVLSVITDKNREFQATAVSWLATLLEQGRNEGVFREVDSQKVAYIIDALLRSFHYLGHLGLESHDPRDLVDVLFDLLSRGLVER